MMRRARLTVGLSALALAATCVTFVVGAQAVPPQSGVIDLRTDAKLRIDGRQVLERVGSSVDIAGDVNGDGKLDLVLGIPGTHNTLGEHRGGAYVLFGGGTSSFVDLAAFDGLGFRIGGEPLPEMTGTNASAAADVNGDGLGDVVLGKQFADHNGRTDSGSVYVVYGKSSTSPVDLAALGSGGFRIDGEAAGDRAGYSISGAGDVNKDGFSDVLVGAPYTASQAGKAYVVFGSASQGNVDLGDLGTRGFRILPAHSPSLLGNSVAPAGDMNGDGFADVVLGAPSSPASAYVVFGKADTAPVALATLGAGGFRILGSDEMGEAVSGAGDVNGDGRPDVIVATSWAGNNDRQYSGSAWVVFGKTSATPVDLAALGDGGFRVDGASPSDRVGWAISGAGDVNNDGKGDVLVGAPFTDYNGRTDSGSAYVVFGRTSSTPLDLAQLGTNGYRLDGATAEAQNGEALAGGRDLSGDGLSDVVIAAAHDSVNPLRPFAGSVYVFGFGQPRLAYAPVQAVVGEPILTYAPTTLERTGPATFQVAPPLPAGLSMDAAGKVSGTPGAVHSQTHTVTMEDLVGTATAQLAITVVAPPPPPPLPDTTAPRLTLRATSPQRALRQKKILVRASCNEACSLSALGTITILGRRPARVALRSASSPRLTAGQRTLSLVLTRAQLKRLSGFLAKGRRARANVTVRARDAAGNRRTGTRAIVVRR